MKPFRWVMVGLVAIWLLIIVAISVPRFQVVSLSDGDAILVNTCTGSTWQKAGNAWAPMQRIP